MPGITCPKCGRLNGGATGAPDEVCPYCGVVYAKARSSRFEGAPTVVASNPPLRSTPRSGQSFTERLRAESNYPTFRTVASFIYLVGVVIAVLLLIGSVFVMVKVSFGAGVGGLVGSLIVFVMSKAGKEAAVMLADLSDATLRMAARQEAA